MAAAGAAPRRSRIGTVSVVLLMLTLGSASLAACGRSGDNPYGLADFQNSTGSTASPVGTGPGQAPGGTPSVTPTSSPAGPQITIQKAPTGMVSYTPGDVFTEGAWVERGAIAGATGDRKAVVDAVLAYLSARAEMSNTWIIDNRSLAAVASGQALTSAVARTEAQRADDSRSVGKFVLNLSSVTVNGDAAVVSGCPFDATVEVSGMGSVMSDVIGGVKLTMNLERKGGRWRAVTFPATVIFCTAPAR